MSVRLDNLAVRYMTTRRETDFNALYSEFNRIYSPKYQIKAVSLGLDIHDVQAAHDDALLKTLNIFNPDKGIFSHYLNTTIKNSLTDLMRKNNRWKTRVFVSLFLDKDLLSDVNIENSVINQVNAGDEWLVIKQDTPFESYTTQAMSKSEFLNRMERISKASLEQCKALEY